VQIEDTSKYDRLVFPFAFFDNIKILLNIISNSVEKGPDRKQLAMISNVSVSTVSNTMNVALNLGLVYRLKEKYYVTEKGETLIKNIKNNNLDEIKKIGTEIFITLKKSPVLFELYNIFMQKQNISPHDLGRLVAEKFNKKWISETTYTNFGNSGLDILEGFYLIQCPKTNIHAGRNVRRKSHIQRNVNKLFPRVSVEKIMEYVDKFKGNGSVQFISPLHSESEKSQIRLQLGTLIDLGIIEHEKEYFYRLTADGLLLKEFKRKGNEHLIFKRILLNFDPIKNIIEKIRTYNKAIDYLTVGNFLDQFNNSCLSENSKKWYGSKLIGWLKFANIIEETHEHGKYHIHPFLTDAIKVIDDTKIISIQIKEHDDFNENVVLNNLHRYYNWLIFSDGVEWIADTATKNSIINNLNKLIEETNGFINLLLVDAKKWVEQGYKNKDMDCIKHSLKLIIYIDKNHREINS
jgi:Mn-dependent DtxR family transcriptional regulator